MDKKTKHNFISKRTLGLVENLSKKSINVKRKLDYDQFKNIRKVSFQKYNTFKPFYN